MKVFHLNYRCPDLQTQEDAEIVKESLVNLHGVGDIEVDFRSKQVKVVTADQDGEASVIRALKQAGFPIED